MNIREEWDQNDPVAREKCRNTILNELVNMKKRNIWTNINVNDLPQDKRLIGIKWVFKVKDNRTHNTSLVEFEYVQVPGVEFDE